jgi:acetamidase/formamidase
VAWGYFDNTRPPALVVAPGDEVAVEAITHHAGDAPDLLMDDVIERIFAEVDDRGPGPHLLTGPIAVAGAQPGDVLRVRLLSLEPRHAHGSNFAGNWGHLAKDMDKERVTIWSIDSASMTARPEFAYDWPGPPTDRPGTIVAPGAVERESIAPGVVAPLRPHLGTMGVAPAAAGRHSSIPPGDHGGNIDNWRAGVGTAMYYPVAVPGALLSLGDPHLAQGDGEVSGTGLEASLDVMLQLDLVSGGNLAIDVPTLETSTSWYVHGFGDDLDEAMLAASRHLLRFLRRGFGLSSDDAYSLMSVACDFGVTQVVDGRQGVHAGVAKAVFSPSP